MSLANSRYVLVRSGFFYYGRLGFTYFVTRYHMC